MIDLGSGMVKFTHEMPCGILAFLSKSCLPRKEVIQPQLPLQLPCYDFVPVTSPTLKSSYLAVRPPSLGVTSFHDVTGGVYKAREQYSPHYG